MPLSGSAFWAVVVPVGDRTNLPNNPSYERGSAGAFAIASAAIGTITSQQQFGATALLISPNTNGTSGAGIGSWTAGFGTIYSYSAYVKPGDGVDYRMAVADSSGLNFFGSTLFTGGGTWQRYGGTYQESIAGNNTRTIVITKVSGNNVAPIYVDGFQVEAGRLTTYIDGDQEGCIWLGDPHNSQSLRSGTYRGGGTVIALADLGLKPDQYPGVGMPPLDVTMQSYALQPGAEYQRSRAEERPFTLTFSPIQGTTLQGLHVTRRTLLNVFKPDLVSPQQPIRFWYTGGQGTVQIDAVYHSGLEFGDLNGPMAEDGAVKFIAPDPYWEATTQEGTSLSARVALGSANFIVRRDNLGRWGTLGANGSATETTINALAYSNGTVILGGGFGSTAGTRSGALSFYNEQTGVFGTYGGTVQTTGINAIAVDADGTIIFGGGFTNISGLSNTRFIARYANGFATIAGGTVNAKVNDMAWTGGTLAIGGAFTGVAGTTTGQLAFWGRSGYGSTSNGTMNAEVFGVTTGLDRRVFVGFQFAGANAFAGTTANHVGQYFGSWGTLGLGMESSGAGLQGVAVGPNGIFYAGGEFQNAGGGSAVNVAYWNGIQWFAMGSGVGIDTAGAIQITKMVADPTTGDVYAIGGDRTGGIIFPDAIARWNGYRWLPLDIDFISNNAPSTLLLTPARTLYVAGGFNGAAFCAGVAQLVNTGMGDAYPIVKIRNTSAGTIRLYQLGNTLSGDMLYFDMTFEPGEELTFVSEPGLRSFTSSFAGNVFSKILGGSNITGFRLLSGTNYVSLFCDSGSVTASIYWRPRHDSIDGGTIY